MKKLEKICTIVGVLLLVAGLSLTLGFFVERETHYQNILNANHAKAYYASLDAVSDIEMKLNKLTVASGSNVEKELLNDVWMNCEIAVVNLGELAGKNDEIEKVTKFVNQLGDYSYYLSSKLPEEPIDENERELLNELYKITEELLKELIKAGESVNINEGLYVKLDEAVATLKGVFDMFNNSIDYPEMIYDGPFSDGLIQRDAKYLVGKDVVDRERVEGYITSKLGFSASFLEEINGNIPSYVFTIEDVGSVTISKQGCVPVQYASSRDVGEKAHSQEECIARAESFIAGLGFAGMRAVWASESEDLVYINLAYEENGVIYYPDLIKVKIAQDNMEIMGFDTTGFIYNHTERMAVEGVKDKSEVKVSDKLSVTSIRLAVIPTEWNKEIATYEVAGTYEGKIYYVYVDAFSLEEVKVMRVIMDENQGALIS